MSTLALVSGQAFANPEDAVVQAGSATITSSGKKLDIYQSSQKAVIDWRSFNIEADEHTEFHQPSSSAFTLNRVKTNDPTRIDGMLSANGNIAIINPNGVYFGAGAKVDVGGMVATTADIDNDDFMNGNMAFNKSGLPDAAIVNDGRITAREAGLVGLVAPRVENNGIIQARLGKVALASGDTFVMDMAGDNFISVAVDETKARTMQQTIKNSGTIVADGGQIILTAAAARETVDSLITNKGVIQANSVGMKNGKIVLGAAGSNRTNKAGTSTSVNEGTITAKGMQKEEKGGSVEILADHTGAMDHSMIDVSGMAGGGSVKIGGAYQGGTETQAAKMTYVSNSAIIDASATDTGDGGEVIVWADDTTRYAGSIKAEGGTQSGNGGFVEVSGKADLNFNGDVSTRAVNGKNGTLLLDPTNIVISNGADTNVNGATPFSPTIDDGPSILNVTTLQNALASGNVTVQTRATGTQAGDITVSNAVTWAANTLTLDAHNNISVNAVMSGPNLTLNLDGDLALNAGVSGAGALTITPKSNATSIGVAGGAGTINLSTADLNNISNGWGSINIGSLTGTGNIAMNAHTWQDSLNINTNTGIISIDGAQAFGANTFKMVTDNDVTINAAISGTGAFSLHRNSFASLGLGDGATGTINLTNAELARLSNGWGILDFVAGDMDVRTYTWLDSLYLTTGSGVVTINGNQTITAGGSLSINSNSNPVLNANLIGTGILNLAGTSDSTTIGLGGGTGTFNLDATELGRITDGWSQINIGKTTGTGNIAMNAHTWQDNLNINTNTGILSIDGAQSFGANNFRINTENDVAFNAAISGTGIFRLYKNTFASMGLGDGATGTINLSNTELARLSNGWAQLDFYSGNMDVRSYTWFDSVRFGTNNGIITINGDQTITAGQALTIESDNNPIINANLIGTGTLTLAGAQDSTTIGFGGSAGAFNLDATELGRITNGWSQINIGRTTATGAINVGANTWNDNLTLRSGTGVITIAGAQNMGANNLMISTNADVAVNADLIGTGILTLVPTTSTTMGLGSASSGTVKLDDAELNRLIDGWTRLDFGYSPSVVGIATNIDLRARTWTDAVAFYGSNLDVNGAQSFGANNVNMYVSGINLNNTVDGTGTLTVRSIGDTTLGIGTGATGSLNLTNTELDNISSNWQDLVFGFVNWTQPIDMRAYTWRSNLTVTSGTSVINVNGAQTMAAGKNLTFITNVDPVINAALAGTGNLTFKGQPYSGTNIGVAGGGGTLNISIAETANITDGWTNIIFGGIDGSGGLAVNAATWNDNLTLQTNTGVITVAGAQTMGANNLTIGTDNNLVLNANLSGSGTLNIRHSNNSTTYGIGDGSTGTLNLTNAELARILDGWNLLQFGSGSVQGAMDIRAYTWLDSVLFQSFTGAINVNGAQNMGANNLTIASDVDVAINAALTGTGTLTVQGSAAGTTIGVGGAAGTLNLSTAELANITNGWGNITIGSTNSTGAMALNAATWDDNLTLINNAGTITVSGAQTIGANNLTIQTSVDPAINAALNGTGTLTIQGVATGTTIGVGGAAGALNLSTADLANITNGWANIVIGSATGTGALTANAATWNDNLTLQTLAGNITINGAQNVGANNLTIFTSVDPVINAALTGTGRFELFQNAGATMGLAGGAGTINMSVAELNFLTDGWTSTEFKSGNMDVGAYTWRDNLILRTGGGTISINGAQNVGANNLTISTNNNPNINAALTGTGTLTFEGASAATTIGIGGAAGTLNLTTAELANITNGWAGVVLGSTIGTGAITLNATTWNDFLTLQSLTGPISINGAQTMGGNRFTILSDADSLINAAITSTNSFNVDTISNGITMGIGTGQAGTVSFTDAELDYLTDGFFSLNFTNKNAAMNVGARTWLDPLTFIAGSGTSGILNINGAQNMGANALNLRSHGDTAINAAVTGTADLAIFSSNSAVSMGLAGAAGSINLGVAELDQITDGWNNIILGGTGQIADMNVNAYTWRDTVTLQTDTGIININGNQNMGANTLGIYSNSNPVINANLIGTGTLGLRGTSVGTTIGIGGAGGTYNIDSAELARITNGWANIVVGTTSTSGAINVGANTWSDNLEVRSSSGLISVLGAQTMGGNALSFITNNLDIGANLSGTGALTFRKAAVATTLGIGDGATGTLNFTNAELGFIQDGWSSIGFGNGNDAYNQAIDLRAYTWLDNVNIYATGATGILNVNGAQNMGANNLNYTVDYLNLAAPINGTGSLNIGTYGVSAGATVGLGDGATGMLNLTNAELDQIGAGWANVTIGNHWTGTGAGAMDVRAYNWKTNTELRNTAGITINGAQIMAAGKNLTLTTNNDPNILVALSGTGTLTIQAQGTTPTIGVAGGTGTINLSTAELNQVTDGWAGITIGKGAGTGAITADAYIWNDNLSLISNTGVITVNGVQNMGANNLTIQSNASPVLNAALTGTGELAFMTTAPATTIGVAGGAGTFNLGTAILDNITDGWSRITIGSSTGGGALTANAYTWRDSLRYWTAGGVIAINGAQTMGANDLTIRADSDPAINAALTGTGNLYFEGGSAATFVGLAGAAGYLYNLSTAELDRIADGWSNIFIGRSDQAVSLGLNAYTWRDNLTLLTGTGTIDILQAQTMGANALTFITDANPNINAGITSAGTITLKGQSVATSIGVGGGSGTLNLDDAELGRISSGTLIIGDAVAGTGDVDLDSWDLSAKTHAVNIYGNDIDIGGVTLGTGNFTAYAKDNGVDVGDLTLSGNITKAVAGMSMLLLKADSTIANLYDGTYYNGIQSPGIASSVGNLNVQIHSDANAINGGAINFVDTSVISNGGDIHFGGGLDLLTGYAQGIAGYNNGYGIRIAQNVNAGDGNIYIRGNGDGASDAIRLGQEGVGPNTIETTAGNIMIRSSGTSRLDASAVRLTTTTGNVDIAMQNIYAHYGAIIRSTGSGNVIMNLVGGYGAADNSVIGDAAMTGNIYLNQNFAGCCELNMRTQGDIYIAPLTASRSIGLGGGAGDINLYDGLLSGITMARKLIIGDSVSGTGDINVQTWDLSARSYDVELYGNDINLSGLTLGSGNFTAFAKDNGVDYGTMTVSAAMSKAVAGASTLTLRADKDVIFNTGSNLNTTTGSTNLIVNSDSNSTLDGVVSITSSALNTNGGTVALNSNNNAITLAGANSFGGNTTINAGTSTITTTSTVGSGAHDLTMTADDLVLGGNISGTGSLTLQPTSTNRIVNLNYGTADGTNFNLSTAEIGRLMDGWSAINIGRTNGGVDTNIGLSSWSDPVNFYNGRKLVHGPLTGTGDSSFTFLGTTNVDVMGNITTAGGAIDFSAPSYVYFAFNPTLNSNGGNISLQRILRNSSSSSATINSSGGNINIIDTIYNNFGTSSGQTLGFNAGAGMVNFGNTVNTQANITATGNTISTNGAWGGTTPLGDVNLTSINSLTLPSITASSILARTTGATSDITIGAGRTLTASGTGSAMTLASGRNFINNSGASALSTPSGRWLIYSASPAADTIGGLSNDFRRFSCTYGGSCPTLGTGDGMLYSATPTLSVAPSAVSITYGDAPPLTGYAYTLTGYLGSDAGDDLVTGSLNGSSTYSQFDDVGVYNIDYGSGTLTSAMGYAISGYTDSATALTVLKKDITAAFTGLLTKTYGDANPTIDYSNFTFSTLVGGDNASLFTGITPNFGAVDANSNAGSGYAVTAAIGSTTNYNVTNTPSTTMTINQRTLSVITDAKSKAFIDPDPVFTGSSNLTAYDAALVSFTYAPIGYGGLEGTYLIDASASDPSSRLANYVRANTYNNFIVGTAPAPFVPTSPAIPNNDIVRILTEPLNSEIQKPSLFLTQDVREEEGLVPFYNGNNNDWFYIIEDLLAIDPALQERFQISYNENNKNN